jgi:hypothetical protein
LTKSQRRALRALAAALVKASAKAQPDHASSPASIALALASSLAEAAPASENQERQIATTGAIWSNSNRTKGGILMRVRDAATGRNTRVNCNVKLMSRTRTFQIASAYARAINEGRRLTKNASIHSQISAASSIIHRPI